MSIYAKAEKLTAHQIIAFKSGFSAEQNALCASLVRLGDPLAVAVVTVMERVEDPAKYELYREAYER